MRSEWMLAVLGAAMLVGCNEGEVPIGTSEQSLLVGDWEGYIEHLSYPSGSDAVHMSITAASATTLTGTITFGTPASFPTPTDPEAAYPDEARCNAESNPVVPVLEGSAFTILEPDVTDLRIRFGIQQAEPWKPYCELQTPVAWASDHYECLPNGASKFGGDSCAIQNEATGQYDEVSCCQYRMCGTGLATERCTCDASGCTVRMSASGIAFDLEVEGDDADGTVIGIRLGPTPGNVRLTRVQ